MLAVEKVAISVNFFGQLLLICVPSFGHFPVIQVCCKGGGGAANNWAYGYCCYGPQCAQAVLSAVSREAEQCDHLGGIVVLHSAAGNTSIFTAASTKTAHM
jgi:Tubulin/FtsZ family, GTPase domain